MEILTYALCVEVARTIQINGIVHSDARDHAARREGVAAGIQLAFHGR